MLIRWNYHSNFSVEYAGAKIIFDPFFADNGKDKAKRRSITDGTTHVLLTHGHDDHIGNVLEICQENDAMLVANFEIINYFVGKGLPEILANPANIGGTVNCGSFTTTFVIANHSSSTQIGGGDNIYLGNPSGLILHAEGEKTLYNMGDTDIFSDMALINELHQPEVGIVPIGDRFTMGGTIAALACRRYFNFSDIVPCHYQSFPIIDQTADTFLAAMEQDSHKVRLLETGAEPIEL